jgi:hypothetical protein
MRRGLGSMAGTLDAGLRAGWLCVEGWRCVAGWAEDECGRAAGFGIGIWVSIPAC